MNTNKHIHNNNYYKISDINSILNTKENRAAYREFLIKKYKKPLLVFSLNIPYNKKNSNIINFNFNLITSKIIWALSPIIHYVDIQYSDDGNVLFLVFNDNPANIKKLFTYLEENTYIGRLLDIDIYDINNNKLSRGTLRKCFICEKPAFDCARSNRHTKKEINQYVQNILYKNFKEYLSNTMTNAIYDELYTTPKPGLVDLNNNGSHKDLNIHLLQKSIRTISIYFPDVIDTTYDFIKNKKMSDNDYKKLFILLQKIGINIENKMFEATKNVNTHKGAIYLSILILSALTIIITKEEKYDCQHCFLDELSNIIHNIVKYNYHISMKASIKTPKTHGDYVYKKFNTFGPREEAYNGINNIVLGYNNIKNNFNNLSNDFITNFDKYKNNNIFKNKNNFNIFNNFIYPIALIDIMSNISDTNMIHRGGMQALDYAKKECKKILGRPSKYNNKQIINKIYALDKNFIKKNLSPGGSADILSMSIFLSKITNLFLYDLK